MQRLVESVGRVLHHAAQRLIEAALFVCVEDAIGRLGQSPDRPHVEGADGVGRELVGQIGTREQAMIAHVSTGHDAILTHVDRLSHWGMLKRPLRLATRQHSDLAQGMVSRTPKA